MVDAGNYKQTYETFWKELVENPDGSLNRDRVMRELHDYHFVMGQASLVYDHVADVSKPNTMAFEVIREADERVDRLIEESELGDFARWVISLDDPDGPGHEARRAVTMAQIIGKAREALNLPEEA